MALLQRDSGQYPNDFEYQSTSPSTKPQNLRMNSPFDTYEFNHLQSTPFPHTPSYNGSYQNSPYSGHSELSFDPEGPESFGLLGDELNGLATRDEYDPSEYDGPNSSSLLMFDGDFLDPNGAQVSVSVTPAPLDQHSPLSFDHSSPSSNGDGAPRSRASSVSSNPNPQIHSGSSPRLDVAHTFEKLRFESPHWATSHLPIDRATSPPKKAQSPPQLLIPDSSPSARPLFSQDPPLINAPEGDGGFMSGPQLHIVPATPVSGGGAASQSVPFQSTLETLHQGKSPLLDMITFYLRNPILTIFVPCVRFTSVQVQVKPGHSNGRLPPSGISNSPKSPSNSGWPSWVHSPSRTATLIHRGCPLRFTRTLQIPPSSSQIPPSARAANQIPPHPCPVLSGTTLSWPTITLAPSMALPSTTPPPSTSAMSFRSHSSIHPVPLPTSPPSTSPPSSPNSTSTRPLADHPTSPPTSPLPTFAGQSLTVAVVPRTPVSRAPKI